MGLRETFMQAAASLLLERPGKARPLDQWQGALTTAGAAIDQRAVAAKDPVHAGRVLRHITGIERWGQRRLQVFLGSPAISDEYDGYRPHANLTIDEQRACFRQARADTLALVAALKAADTLLPTVSHNDFGPLGAHGWLRYLDMHATLESKKIATR